jgi:hypothetical protein
MAVVHICLRGVGPAADDCIHAEIANAACLASGYLAFAHVCTTLATLRHRNLSLLYMSV